MRRAVLPVVAALVAASCSGAGETGSVAEPATVAATDPSPTGDAASSSPPTADEPSTPSPSSSEQPPSDTRAGDAPTTDPPTTTIVDVVESGVPGLDSPDAFCAAWSRFGGSWQVLLVASVFGSDEQLASELEVVAAPVVDAAHDALVAAFPGDLEAEQDTVMDGYFGPFARRSADALTSLRQSGANDSDIAALAAAWTEALAARDPADPLVAVELADEQAAIVERAAADFRTKRVGLAVDPSMVIVVDTPATDRFLETACPDQGSLTGQEVPGSSDG